MSHVFASFIQPLSACFSPKPGQDFEAFGRQLAEDLAPYPESVLKEGASIIRRSHASSTWPTIAVCIRAVEEAAHRQYVPPEKPQEKPRGPLVPLTKIRLDPGGGMLSVDEMRSCPPGTQFSASDATIHYTNGAIETWGEFRKRRRGARESHAGISPPG